MRGSGWNEGKTFCPGGKEVPESLGGESPEIRWRKALGFTRRGDRGARMGWTVSGAKHRKKLEVLPRMEKR